MHWLSNTLSYESLYLQSEDVLGFSRFKEAVNSANKARYTLYRFKFGIGDHILENDRPG